MRIRLFLIIISAVVVAAIPIASAEDKGAKDDSKTPQASKVYEIVLDKTKPARLTSIHPEPPYKPGNWVSLDFAVNVLDPTRAYKPDDMIIIKEDNQEVLQIPLRQKGDLSIILGLDSSGSMREGGKIGRAKMAADEFLKILHENADPGFIAFNTEIVDTIPPLGKSFLEEKDKSRKADMQQKQKVRIAEAKDKVVPDGGTGYLKATVAAINMLKGAEGNKAVVIITDGKDRESKLSINDVITEAKNANVQVYIIGVGSDSGPVTGVLVLDHSGSMGQRANDNDTKKKIDALKDAACEFIDQLRPGVSISLLPFSTVVEPPGPFLGDKDKERLKDDIRKLEPTGGTQLYDAMCDGIMSLAATNPEGKRRLIVMTDGVDEAPGSRHRYEEVMELAKRENVQVHLVGFGREHEINMVVMDKMKGDDGTAVHANNHKELEKFFEKQRVEINQEALDKKSLTELAESTGGKFASAENVASLSDALKEMFHAADQTYHPVFPSRYHDPNGLLAAVEVDVVNTKTGEKQSVTAKTTVYQHGIVLPGLDWRWYLVLLALLAGLLIVPSVFRFVTRMGRA